ncbi:phosducin family protein [Aspergillus candidus]|uniref:Thioredoxin-like protein n=1 Tax=Aspergillus candidus TaxID=41067 RepID=A0A2I2EXR8_ASPCN|nr:thioredoxin-like protein [Aspergillus candidus]PLB33151.1 thioredoxin-like protein [Aspergillus candidus]
MSSAQEEFNQLVSSNRDKFSSHPEDRNVSDHESDDDSDKSIVSEPEDSNMAAGGPATYHVPRTVYDANTGPKGVIADAQAFERARKSSFRNTFRSKDHARGASKSSKDDATLLYNSNPPHGSASDDDEDRFLRQWREERMQELQGRNGRRNSPWRKVYGSVDTVDAVGYLDAIEKVPSDAVVVVCLNDPDSHASAQVEDCLDVIARRQPGIHFVKMHYEIAEMDHIKAPALLAYRDGDVFATIVDIATQIPKGRPCTADTLEDLLKSYRVL